MHDHDVEINSEKLDLIIKDQRVRRELTRKCHYWFFHIYFPHYVKYKSAEFHKELFELTEDTTYKMVVIEASRGSAKTTLMGTSHAIWSILGEQQRKFVVLLAKTESQARQYLTNIKLELESNALLRSDLGPFEEPVDEWRATSIVLPRYGARITVASTETSIRGIKHGAHRPDLIICDDLENSDSVKTQEMRDKTYSWLTRDIIPLGDLSTRIIVIGTKLHNDSIIGRLKNEIAEGARDGITKRYPFLKEDGTAMWPEKFPTQADIGTQMRLAGPQSWECEYMLNVVEGEDQVIRREWIQYYDQPPTDDNYRFSATGVDPAIGEKQNNDCTAIVSGRVYGRKKTLKIYVLPNPVNERLNSLRAIERIKAISENLGNGSRTTIWVESVAYQKSIIEQLVSQGFPAKEYKPHGGDKRARLALIAQHVQTGLVLFPRHGAEKLIEQLIGFGSEKHDDLSDAFCILVSSVIDQESNVTKGYRELFTEKILENSYHEKLPLIGEKRLGVSLADGTGTHSAIVLRAENVAEVLYHDITTDVSILAKKVVEFALKYDVPLSDKHIFVDKSDDRGRELCEQIRKHAKGKFILDKYEWRQGYGIEMSDTPQFEDDMFTNDWIRAFSKLKGWLEKGGRLIGRHAFDDLLYMIYTESNNKRKLIDRQKLFENGIDTSIPDALALTTAKEKKTLIRPTEDELFEENELLHPEIGF
jgi:predicted phage terminase large subunit-like protein